jgi:hypothetical protein
VSAAVPVDEAATIEPREIMILDGYLFGHGSQDRLLLRADDIRLAYFGFDGHLDRLATFLTGLPAPTRTRIEITTTGVNTLIFAADDLAAEFRKRYALFSAFVPHDRAAAYLDQITEGDPSIFALHALNKEGEVIFSLGLVSREVFAPEANSATLDVLLSDIVYPTLVSSDGLQKGNLYFRPGESGTAYETAFRLLASVALDPGMSREAAIDALTEALERMQRETPY